MNAQGSRRCRAVRGAAPVGLHLDPVLGQQTDAHPGGRQPTQGDVPKRLGVGERRSYGLHDHAAIVGERRGGVVGAGREVDRDRVLSPSGDAAEGRQFLVGGVSVVSAAKPTDMVRVF
jgi:hypothetical protein